MARAIPDARPFSTDQDFVMPFRVRAFAPALCSALFFVSSPALAHGVMGARFFPATIATDDPFVADELALPTVAWFRNADGERETDISGEWSKRITPTVGFSVEGGWTHLPHAEGFQNVETSLRWQFVTDPERELVVSAGLGAEWGGTGAERVGAESVSAVVPSLAFGKGFGDLPDRFGWARPFAVTGQIAYVAPTEGHDDEGERTPHVLEYGFALEYSLPYLRAQVRDHGWPEWVNHLTPVVEATFETPVLHGGGERTTGTVNPGLIWSGRRMQFGAEAIVPVNGDSGRSVGFLVQTHFYLDDLFPRSLGKPIYSGRR
jgi:hypothetical protein